jgi:hypothetical protein
MNSDLLISMFVSGKYQHYMPMFELFLDAAYPEYDFIINRVLCSDDAKFLRWRKLYFNYDVFKYVYIGDIDILIMRDTPTLLEKHLAICEKQNLPFSNTCGIDDPATRGHRVTGIHFFQNDERGYLERMRAAVSNMKPESYYYNDKLGRIDNQHALYCLLQDAGYTVPDHKEFYYDGLHLGHSRVVGRWDQLLSKPQSDANYPLFWAQFREIAKSETYALLYGKLPPFIKSEIDTMTEAMERAYE